MSASRLITVFVLAIAAAAFCAVAGARDIYVDNVAGDDLHNGFAPRASLVGGGPCRTIAKALRLAGEGDRIVLAATGEPYRESITLQAARHSGSASRPFVLLGNGATLDGSRPVNPEAWEHYDDGVFRFQPRRMSYQQLFLDDVPLVRVPVDNNQLRLPKLRPLEWCLFQRQIYLNVKKPTEEEMAEDESLRELVDAGWKYLPQQYNLSHAGHPVGITLYDVRNVVIADLTVQGYQLDGINAHDNALNVSLVGVTTRGNGRSGISVGGASQVKVVESAARYNGAAQVRTEGYCRTEITGSELLSIGGPALVREGGEVTIDGQVVSDNRVEQDILPDGATAPPPPGG